MSVYFAQVGPYIKVGYSANPERRVRNLFKSATRYALPPGTPLDIGSRHLIRAIVGDKDTEYQIHKALDDFQILLEWYVDEPEIRDFIANVETADEYDPVARPAGPVSEPYDESKLPPAEQVRLMAALNDIGRAMSGTTLKESA